MNKKKLALYLLLGTGISSAFVLANLGAFGYLTSDESDDEATKSNNAKEEETSFNKNTNVTKSLSTSLDGNVSENVSYSVKKVEAEKILVTIEAKEEVLTKEEKEKIVNDALSNLPKEEKGTYVVYFHIYNEKDKTQTMFKATISKDNGVQIDSENIEKDQAILKEIMKTHQENFIVLTKDDDSINFTKRATGTGERKPTDSDVDSILKFFEATLKLFNNSTSKVSFSYQDPTTLGEVPIPGKTYDVKVKEDGNTEAIETKEVLEVKKSYAPRVAYDLIREYRNSKLADGGWELEDSKLDISDVSWDSDNEVINLVLTTSTEDGAAFINALRFLDDKDVEKIKSEITKVLKDKVNFVEGGEVSFLLNTEVNASGVGDAVGYKEVGNGRFNLELQNLTYSKLPSFNTLNEANNFSILSKLTSTFNKDKFTFDYFNSGDTNTFYIFSTSDSTSAEKSSAMLKASQLIEKEYSNSLDNNVNVIMFQKDSLDISVASIALNKEVVSLNNNKIESTEDNVATIINGWHKFLSKSEEVTQRVFSNSISNKSFFMRVLYNEGIKTGATEPLLNQAKVLELSSNIATLLNKAIITNDDEVILSFGISHQDSTASVLYSKLVKTNGSFIAKDIVSSLKESEKRLLIKELITEFNNRNGLFKLANVDDISFTNDTWEFELNRNHSLSNRPIANFEPTLKNRVESFIRDYFNILEIDNITVKFIHENASGLKMPFPEIYNYKKNKDKPYEVFGSLTENSFDEINSKGKMNIEDFSFDGTNKYLTTISQFVILNGFKNAYEKQLETLDKNVTLGSIEEENSKIKINVSLTKVDGVDYTDKAKEIVEAFRKSFMNFVNPSERKVSLTFVVDFGSNIVREFEVNLLNDAEQVITNPIYFEYDSKVYQANFNSFANSDPNVTNTVLTRTDGDLRNIDESDINLFEYSGTLPTDEKIMNDIISAHNSFRNLYKTLDKEATIRFMLYNTVTKKLENKLFILKTDFSTDIDTSNIEVKDNLPSLNYATASENSNSAPYKDSLVAFLKKENVIQNENDIEIWRGGSNAFYHELLQINISSIGQTTIENINDLSEKIRTYLMDNFHVGEKLHQLRIAFKYLSSNGSTSIEYRVIETQENKVNIDQKYISNRTRNHGPRIREELTPYIFNSILEKEDLEFIGIRRYRAISKRKVVGFTTNLKKHLYWSMKSSKYRSKFDPYLHFSKTFNSIEEAIEFQNTTRATIENEFVKLFESFSGWKTEKEHLVGLRLVFHYQIKGDNRTYYSFPDSMTKLSWGGDDKKETQVIRETYQPLDIGRSRSDESRPSKPPGYDVDQTINNLFKFDELNSFTVDGKNFKVESANFNSRSNSLSLKISELGADGKVVKRSILAAGPLVNKIFQALDAVIKIDIDDMTVQLSFNDGTDKYSTFPGSTFSVNFRFALEISVKKDTNVTKEKIENAVLYSVDFDKQISKVENIESSEISNNNFLMKINIGKDGTKEISETFFKYIKSIINENFKASRGSKVTFEFYTTATFENSSKVLTKEFDYRDNKYSSPFNLKKALESYLAKNNINDTKFELLTTYKEGTQQKILFKLKDGSKPNHNDLEKMNSFSDSLVNFLEETYDFQINFNDDSSNPQDKMNFEIIFATELDTTGFGGPRATKRFVTYNVVTNFIDSSITKEIVVIENASAGIEKYAEVKAGIEFSGFDGSRNVILQYDPTLFDSYAKLEAVVNELLESLKAQGFVFDSNLLNNVLFVTKEQQKDLDKSNSNQFAQKDTSKAEEITTVVFENTSLHLRGVENFTLKGKVVVNGVEYDFSEEVKDVGLTHEEVEITIPTGTTTTTLKYTISITNLDGKNSLSIRFEGADVKDVTVTETNYKISYPYIFKLKTDALAQTTVQLDYNASLSSLTSIYDITKKALADDRFLIFKEIDVKDFSTKDNDKIEVKLQLRNDDTLLNSVDDATKTALLNLYLTWITSWVWGQTIAVPSNDTLAEIIKSISNQSLAESLSHIISDEDSGERNAIIFSLTTLDEKYTVKTSVSTNWIDFSGANGASAVAEKTAVTN